MNMRKFGDTVDGRLANMKLKPMVNGMSVGDAFYKGMSSIYNYMKNGGQGSGDAPTDQNGQPTQGVERTTQPVGGAGNSGQYQQAQ